MRPGKKEHGLSNQIEGEVRAGQRIVVVEDLISTGGSSLGAVHTLRDAGANIKGMLAIFTYNLSKAEKAFKEANCSLVTLTDYDHLVQKALEIGFITQEDIKILQDFKKSLS